MYKGEKYTFNINNLKIDLKGLAFKNLSFPVGNPVKVDYYDFVNSNNALSIEYDENYF